MASSGSKPTGRTASAPRTIGARVGCDGRDQQKSKRHDPLAHEDSSAEGLRHVRRRGTVNDAIE
jgi:hypothetical protein